ncbi:MAG: hypothetical protein E7317_08710 [Clostridiales bacterium]|nr:hypothetical protein [Clostridiales bacterium]
MPYALLSIPLFCALMRLFTRKYVFSALTTLSCAALVIVRAPVMAAALAVSAAGDWFMGHKGDNEGLYRMGILCFLLAHVIFIAYALTRVKTVAVPLAVGAALAAGYAVYLGTRVFGCVPALLKIPVAAYSVISLIGFTCALMTKDPLYAIGIGLLLFSDTMIAEHDFVGNTSAGLLILPTYYLCQMLVALSGLL